MRRTLRVVHPGPLAIVEDQGRPGWAHVGVGASGAADRGAHALANRLVGNNPDAATIEVLAGGLSFTVSATTVVATAGAPAPLWVGGRRVDHRSPLYVASGEVVALGVPGVGLRTYVAVGGGVDVPAVLGSRSWDGLAALGPPPLEAGQVVPLGEPSGRPLVDHAPAPDPAGGAVTVGVMPGPRGDWLEGGVSSLQGRPWQVSTRSDRVGVRFDGVPVGRSAAFEGRELLSEGVVRGGIQVPPSGLPVVFLNDHPVTGGYPVVGVLTEADADRLAQVRPGQTVWFA